MQMLRERHKWRPHEADNIEAVSRDGATRSSDEGLVMKPERRGSRDRSMGDNHFEKIIYGLEDGRSLQDLWERCESRGSRTVLRGAGLKCLVYSP